MTSLSLHDIDELRERLLHVWRGFEQSLIDDAVDQWPTRLCAYVCASGGHFEHTRVMEKFSRLFCAILCSRIVHSAMHTHMNKPNSSLD